MSECEFVPGTKQDPRRYTVLTGGAKAHRVQWEKFFGPIPEGMHVLHTCDTPGCINIEHLFLGTNADNMRDMAAKGRGRNQNSGATHCKWGHEFTEENTLRYNGKRHCRKCGALRSWEGRLYG
jgi:hypothetical protein